MEMDRKQASRLWNMLCTEEIGVDSDGDVVERPTRLGIAMQSRGLSKYLFYAEGSKHIKEEEFDKIADFLTEFAQALRGNNE